jgi:hypothetical protein
MADMENFYNNLIIINLCVSENESALKDNEICNNYEGTILYLKKEIFDLKLDKTTNKHQKIWDNFNQNHLPKRKGSKLYKNNHWLLHQSTLLVLLSLLLPILLPIQLPSQLPAIQLQLHVRLLIQLPVHLLNQLLIQLPLTAHLTASRSTATTHSTACVHLPNHLPVQLPVQMGQLQPKRKENRLSKNPNLFGPETLSPLLADPCQIEDPLQH